MTHLTATSKILAPVAKLLPPPAMATFVKAVNESLDAALSHNEAVQAGWAATKAEGWARPPVGKRWIKKDDPGAGAVHVDVPLGEGKPKKKPAVVGKDATPQTLYVNRPLLNADDIRQWAKSQGFDTTLPAGDMHTTIAYSKQPFDTSALSPDQQPMVVPASDGRSVAPLGNEGAVVLHFDHQPLVDRHQEIKDAGASWDYPTFQTHTTVTYDGSGVDLDKVEPYSGPLIFGPEKFAPVQSGWHDNLTEDAVKSFETAVCKVDSKLGIVFGFGIVCTKNGEPYFDVQEDHIPEDSMLKAAADFMQASRISGDMHGRDGAGEPIEDGNVVFAFPLTKDIAKALDISCPQTGLMIGIKPSAAVLSKFESGEYTGFSIGGFRIEDEHVA